MNPPMWNLRLWLKRNSVWLIGSALALGGGVGIWRYQQGLILKFSEACFIAGILSISVDVWLKRKLQEDAARDIFHHLLGLSLPDELRAKLQQFVEENSIYRQDVDIRVFVEDQEDSVSLSVSVDATNVAAKDSKFRQTLTFEESSQAKPISASLRSQTETYYVLGAEQLKLKEKDDEPMVWHWEGDEIPMARGEELHQHVRVTVTRPRKDSYVVFFGRSTINPKLRLEGSDSLKIAASKDEDTLVTGTEYLYRRVFLKGDHIQIRWKPKDEG